MSEITFDCPHCQQTMEAPPEMAGQAVLCPTCEQELTVPAQEAPADIADVAALPEVEASTEEAGNVCPECGVTLQEGAVLCVDCGFHQGLGKKIQTDLS